jgi:hypothetical protein
MPQPQQFSANSYTITIFSARLTPGSISLHHSRRRSLPKRSSCPLNLTSRHGQQENTVPYCCVTRTRQKTPFLCSFIVASITVEANASKRPLFTDLLASNDCSYGCLLSGYCRALNVYVTIHEHLHKQIFIPLSYNVLRMGQRINIKLKSKGLGPIEVLF